MFEFNRNPHLPVFSNWVVDFNAFFDTGVPVPVNNKAREDRQRAGQRAGDAARASPGMMAMLATRNLRRGLALGLPSGQGMAEFFGIPPMTGAQLTRGLPADEVALLNSSGGLLLSKTPLWYYVLREAACCGNGESARAGRRADRRRDVRADAQAGRRLLPQHLRRVLADAAVGDTRDFTAADLVNFAGVTLP